MRCLPSRAQRPWAARRSTAIMVACRSTEALSLPQGTTPGFSSPASAGEYAVAIMGDLHLEPAQMHLFHAAREHLVAGMGAGAPGARVVQLGDLGGYAHAPGSHACFQAARAFLSGFAGVPVALITGNHDLEGSEFETDEENLAAWQQAFGQRHYWAAELGSVLLVGLSTVRFRSNHHSVHEVYIDEAQCAWFEALVAAHPQRPIVVFTHAPPMGCGLKVVQNVHVKNRCAWLNHSDAPQRFIRLVERSPNIRLWFSGHFHLSQNYRDSISVVHRCAFVQAGVIGECNRDGNRQSRLLKLDGQGYRLYTVDHEEGGRLRLDMTARWSDRRPPEPITPEEELICDPMAGWLCSPVDCALLPPGEEQAVAWWPAGANVLLSRQEDMLLEYDTITRAPVGVVAFLEGRTVSVARADGGAPTADDGADVHCVLLTDPQTGEVTRLERNDAGTFYRIFQKNKWLAKRKAAEDAAELVAAAR